MASSTSTAQADSITQLPDEATLLARVSPLVSRAAGIVIESADDDAMAQGYLVDLARGEKTIGAELDPICEAAHRAHKAATGLRSRMLAPFAEARAIVAKKIGTYQAEQRRIAEAERARIEAELRRREEDRRRAEAAEVARLAKIQAEELASQAKAAKEAGDAAAAKAIREEARALKAEAAAEVEAIRTEPIIAPVVHVAARVADVKGVSTSTRWRAEVKSKAELIRWVAARLDSDPGVAAYLEPAMPALNRTAVSQRDELRIGGVVAVSESSVAVRTG